MWGSAVCSSHPGPAPLPGTGTAGRARRRTGAGRSGTSTWDAPGSRSPWFATRTDVPQRTQGRGARPYTNRSWPRKTRRTGGPGGPGWRPELLRERARRRACAAGSGPDGEPGSDAEQEAGGSHLQTLPTPARLRWSSRASPSGRAGPHAGWPGPARVPVRAQQVRAEMADGALLVDGAEEFQHRGGDSRRPCGRPCRGSRGSGAPGRRSSADRPRTPSRSRPSAGARCAVRPPSTRVSRCLPRGVTSRTVRPVRSAVAYRGTRKSLRSAPRPREGVVQPPCRLPDRVLLRAWVKGDRLRL